MLGATAAGIVVASEVEQATGAMESVAPVGPLAAVVGAAAFRLISHLVNQLATWLCPRAVPVRVTTPSFQLLMWTVGVSFGVIVERSVADNSLLLTLAVVPFAVMQLALNGHLHRRTHHDPVTGLITSGPFEERLEDVLGSGERTLAVALIGLDRFTKINDTLGHASGDELLGAVASRLRAGLYDRDVVARMGGDEFVLLWTALSSPAHAEHRARRIIDELSKPFVVAGREVLVTASVGVAVHPVDGERAAQLIHSAETALVVAKGQGRNVARRYEAGTATDAGL